LYQCFVFLKRPPTVKKIKLGWSIFFSR
jgi:hypothetical protein